MAIPGPPQGLSPTQHLQLSKLRSHFQRDVRKQLYTDADDRQFFENLKSALKAIDKRLDDSRVALQHLEMMLMNVACDDPGVTQEHRSYILGVDIITLWLCAYYIIHMDRHG